MPDISLTLASSPAPSITLSTPTVAALTLAYPGQGPQGSPGLIGSVLGTTNQVNVATAGATVTLSLPAPLPVTIGPSGTLATYNTTGTADQTIINSAISAVSAAGGGVIRVLAGTYSITGGITVLPGVSFIVDNVGATVIHIATSYNWTTYPHPISAIGSFNGSAINLSADQASSVNVVNVTSTTDYVNAANDELLYLMSNDLWEGNGTDTSGRMKGEYVKINVKSSTSFTTYGTTRDTYTTANTARLYRMNWVEDVVIRNVQIIQDAALFTINNAGALIYFSKCRNVEVSNCRLHDFDNAAIQLNDCFGFKIRDNFIYNLTDYASPNNYLGYAVVLGGACEMGSMTGNNISRVRHGVTTTTGDSSHGVSRNVLITNNNVSHTTNSGLDTHQCGEGVAIINNYISNCQTYGIFDRGRASVIDGNVIEWTGGGINVGISRQAQGGMGASTRVTNNHIRHITHNTYTDVDGTYTPSGHGILLTQSDNLIVKGNVVEYVAYNGINIGVLLTNSIIENNTILNCNQLNSSTAAGILFSANLSGSTASITAFSGTTATLTYAAGGFSSSNYWPGQNITIQGCATPANNGVFVVTAIVDDTDIQYTNASAVSGDANNGSIQFGIGGSTGNILQNNTVVNMPASRTDVDTAGYAKYLVYDSGVTGANSALGNTGNIFKNNSGYSMGTGLFNTQNTGNFYAGNTATESTPIKTVAGVPTDSSFASIPQNGSLALNSTSNSMYVRSGGSWLPFGTTQDTTIPFIVAGTTIMDITATSLQFNQSVTNPAIQQNSTSVASATGSTLTISAQAATGTTSTGGTLNLSGGTGTSSNGGVNIKTGSTIQLQVTPSVVQVNETLVVFNGVAATSGANQNSPSLQTISKYWNGTSSVSDVWTQNNILGTGANPTSTWTLSHSGSSGVAAVSVPSLLATSIFDNGNRVLTTPTAGSGIAITGSAPTLTIANTGVTSAVAGTDITVSGATGAVTIGTSSTLATVTGRGATTATALTLTNATASTSSTTGALQVTGGVGIGGATYVGGTLAAQSTVAATSGANQNSPVLIVGGNVWNGAASIADTFTFQTNYAAGTNPLATLSIVHNGSTGGSQTSLASGNLVIGGAGNFSKYKGVTTAGIGVSPITGVGNLTAQTANVALTALLVSPAAGMYRVSVYLVVTQAATASSTLPDCTITYQDQDSGNVLTIPVTAGNTGNTLSTFASNSLVINANAAHSIQYTIGANTAYASSGATAMQYAARLRLEYLG
jgi:hypothetical protein